MASYKRYPTGNFVYYLDPNGKITRKHHTSVDEQELYVHPLSDSRRRAVAWELDPASVAGVAADTKIGLQIMFYGKAKTDDNIYIWLIDNDLDVGDYIISDDTFVFNNTWGDTSVGSSAYWYWPEEEYNVSDYELDDYAGLITGKKQLLFLYRDEGINQSVKMYRSSYNGTGGCYAIFYTTTAQPEITRILPSSNSLISPLTNQKIRYSLTAPGLIGSLTQKSISGEVKIDDGFASARSSTTSEQAFTLTPEDMSGEITSLRFQVAATNGKTTGMTDWQRYITKDGATNAVPLYPVDCYVDQSKPAEFAWLPGAPYGGGITKSVLQYSADQVDWQPLATIEGAAAKSTISITGLPGGAIYWRVQTYNSAGVAGNWSRPAAISLRGAPQTPSITGITDVPRPLITWQSPGQVAYQLTIGDKIDTGEVAGTGREYQVMDYLPRGSYKVKLRIKNNIGIWSDWTLSSLNIAFDTVAAPVISAQVNDTNVMVTIKNWDSYQKAYLLRDGAPAGKFTQATYADHAAGFSQVYTVLAVGAGDCWSSSVLQVDFSLPEGFTLAPYTQPDRIIWFRQMVGKPREVSRTRSYGGAVVMLLGRQYGVRQYSNQDSDQYQVEAKTDPQSSSLLQTLEGRHEVVLYRDRFGNRAFCSVDRVEESQGKAGANVKYTTTITLSRVDHNEAIAYDLPAGVKLARMLQDTGRRKAVEIHG